MTFKKIARKTYTCGKCVYFDKTNNICSHEKMNKEIISSVTINLPCGAEYFLPLDDYEGN